MLWSIMLLMNIFTFSVVFLFCDPSWWHKLYKRYMLRINPHHYPQKEANEIMGDIQPEMHEWFAEVHINLV